MPKSKKRIISEEEESRLFLDLFWKDYPDQYESVYDAEMFSDDLINTIVDHYPAQYRRTLDKLEQHMQQRGLESEPLRTWHSLFDD